MKTTSQKRTYLKFWAIQIVAKSGRKGFCFNHDGGHMLATYEKDDAVPVLFLTKKEAEKARNKQIRNNKKLTERKLKNIFSEVVEPDYTKIVRVKLFLN